MKSKLLVLITYDVNTETAEGRTRLRRIAKQCINYGQRVQNSVFECNLDPVQFCELKYKLKKIMDEHADSLRFYNLGNHYSKKIEHLGVNPGYDAESTLIV